MQSTLVQGIHTYQEEQQRLLYQELEVMLNALQSYNFIFTGARKVNATPGTITIKLNSNRTKICLLIPDHENEVEIDRDDQNGIIPPIGNQNTIYDDIRTSLQNRRDIIPETSYSESIIAAKQQILKYLLDKHLIEDRVNFLTLFQQFIDELPEVSHEFISAHNQLQEISFEAWDIDESDENDPRLKALGDIHKTMLDSFKAYKGKGEEYIHSRIQDQNSTDTSSYAEAIRTKNLINSTATLTDVEGNTFNVISIPKDGNCFYHAVADQLEKHNIKNEYGINYTHTDLRQLATDYIEANQGQDFGRTLASRLSAAALKELRDDLTEDRLEIHTLKEYIAHHRKEGIWADSGMVYALALKLNITLRVYSGSIPAIHNKGQGEERTVNLQYIGNHYNSLMPRLDSELLPFESSYPKQSYKVKRIFEILNSRERGEELNKQIRIVGHRLGLTDFSIEKLRDYINASKPVRQSEVKESEGNAYWYSDNISIATTKLNEKQYPNIDSLEAIIEKLELIDHNTPNDPLVRIEDGTSQVRIHDISDNKKIIREYIHKINEYYTKVSSWGSEEIKNWAKAQRGQLSKNFSDNAESVDKICQAIAIMDRANELATGGHRLRDTQKMAIVIFMQTNEKGHISQINTGEGKTTIVSVVQALKVLQGYKGHVITSNNVLAADGVKDKGLFYSLLDITVAHNNPDEKSTFKVTGGVIAKI